MLVTVIPNCPKCKSVKTGHYIAGIGGKTDIEEKVKRLKRGERVRLYYLYKPYRNCFCTECEHTWHAEPTHTFMKRKDFLRHLKTHGFLDDRKDINSQLNKNKKVKKVNKSLIYSIVACILVFFTGIDLRDYNPYKKKKK